MAASDEEIGKLFRVRQTVLKMLSDRNYDVGGDDDEESGQTIDGFKARFLIEVNAAGGENNNNINRKKEYKINRQGMRISGKHRRDQSDMFVFFPEENRVGVKTIEKYIEFMHDSLKENKDTTAKCRGIVVVQTSLSSYAKDQLHKFPEIVMECFTESELVVNVTQHMLVPKHTLLSLDEKKELLLRYKLRETQLPRIQIADPLSRYFGLRRGDVMKIERVSETAGRYITYRLVV